MEPTPVAPADHIHTSTPDLHAPWCVVCAALLDWAIVFYDEVMEKEEE